VSIDFDLGDDAWALAKEVNEFLNKNLTPELRAKAHYSWDGHDPGIHKKLADAHLLFPSWPKEYGGRDAGPYAMSAALTVWEQQHWSSHAIATTNMVATMMRKFGSDEFKRDVRSGVINGEAIFSLGLSEPGSGSDVFAAKTRATQFPDGSWRIDGQNMFTSGADISDYVFMLTRTERTNITFYDDVRIPDAYRLGEVNQGLKVGENCLPLLRCLRKIYQAEMKSTVELLISTMAT
jgi:alkylation response protein AidB-like acyl-CoA dehydrogenase